MHITFAAHAPHAISAESVVRSTQISARARIASRSGVGVGVGTASTTAKRLFDDAQTMLGEIEAAALDMSVGARIAGGGTNGWPDENSRSKLYR